MKTIINTFLLTCLLIIYSCSNSGEIVVTGSDGREYRSYETACEYADFNAAYDYVEKMVEVLNDMPEDDFEKGRYSKTKYNAKIEDAREYIVKEEILYLISQGKETDVDRIMYLYLKQDWKTFPPLNDLYSTAVSFNNFNVLKRLLKLLEANDSHFDTRRTIKEILDKNNIDY